MRKKNLFILFAIVSVMVVLASCGAGHNNPGQTYMPDMYYSRAYDAYTGNPNFPDNMTSRLPVAGTVKRNAMLPYNIPESDSGYAASAFVKDPLPPLSPDSMKEAKRTFDIYCGICHGEKLDGNGPLYASGKFPAAPANFMLDKYKKLPIGTMFYSATYGKNLMGSYASQLNEKQRWMVVQYIKSVQFPTASAGGNMASGGGSTAADSSTAGGM